MREPVPSRPDHNKLVPLRSSYANDREMQDLVAYFIDDLTPRMNALQCALQSTLAASEIEQLRAIAHELSGVAAGYGFAPIGDVARALEDQARFLQASDEDLENEMELSALSEKAEDLLTLCARALASKESCA